VSKRGGGETRKGSRARFNGGEKKKIKCRGGGAQKKKGLIYRSLTVETGGPQRGRT